MFKIGEFSHLCQVSVRMLRHYEKMGLLRPAYTDDYSGYRYYSADQIPQVHHVLALKDMGFSLAEIAYIACGGLTSEQVLGMLRLRRSELRRQAGETEARLRRVEKRLADFESGTALSASEVILKRVPPLRVASRRAVVPTYQDGAGPMREVLDFLKAHGLRRSSGYLFIYHDPEYRTHDIDTEAAHPLPASFSPHMQTPGRVHVGELPALEAAACVLYRGDVNRIGLAYGAVGHWIRDNGYHIAGPSRLVWLHEGQTLEDNLMEVQWPVAQG